MNETTWERESSIDREKARVILASEGQAGAYDPLGDYWLCWDEDGGEYLILEGQEEPLASNGGTTSWASPGYPAAEPDGD